MFADAGVVLPVQYAPDSTRRDVEALRPVRLPALETVLPGGRNVAVFDVTRWWAYSAWWSHDGDLASWHALVLDRAFKNNGVSRSRYRMSGKYGARRTASARG